MREKEREEERRRREKNEARIATAATTTTSDVDDAAHDTEKQPPHPFFLSPSLFKTKKKTDWCVRARIVDGTWCPQPSENNVAGTSSPLGAAEEEGSNPPSPPRFPVMVMFFGAPQALPQPRRGGGTGCVAGGCDIIRIHRAQVCDYVYQGQRGRNLVAKVGPAQGHPASYLLFDGREKNAAIDEEDATTPYCSSSRGFSWEPEAEPRMLEALRMLSSYLARQAREAAAAVAAAAAAAAAGEEGEGGGGGGGDAAAAAAIAAAPPPRLMAPPPSAVRHLGLVLAGESGSCDLGPVRVEAVEEREGGAADGATVLWVFDGSDAPPLGGGSLPGWGSALGESSRGMSGVMPTCTWHNMTLHDIT